MVTDQAFVVHAAISSPAVRVTALGQFAIQGADAREIILPTRKAQALFVYLSLRSNLSASRDELAGIFWERSADPQARASLRQTLSSLRQALPAAGRRIIEANKQHVRLDAGAVAVDVREFEALAGADDAARLEQGIAIYRGDLLAGFDLRASVFEEWLETERRRLRACLQGALMKLLVQYERQGSFDRALEISDKLLELDNLDETAYRARMRVLTGQGKRAAALNCYESCRETLRDELGIEPGAETRQLRADILSGTAPTSEKSSLPEARSGRPPSIAVLPLRCLNASIELEYIAECLAEDINTHLARIPGFMVISRASTGAYRDTHPALQTIGAELGVQYLVGGTLRSGASGLKVSVQLTDATSGEHLWVDEFSFPVPGDSAIPDEIAAGILARIGPAVSQAEFGRLASRQPHDLDAWALYRRATGVLSLKGWNEGTFAEAADLLRRATDIAPDLAHAHAYLSLVLALARLTGLTSESTEDRQEAFDAAESALRLDPSNSVVLGHVGCALADLGEISRGLALLDRAIEYDPSNAQAWSARGAALTKNGRPVEGVESLRHGMRISPLDSRLAVWGGMLASALMAAGEFRLAVEEAEKACRRDDKVFQPRVVLAAALCSLGDQERAREVFQDAIRVRPNLTFANVRRVVGPQIASLMKASGLLATGARPPPVLPAAHASA